jgi:hypothetical protein
MQKTLDMKDTIWESLITENPRSETNGSHHKYSIHVDCESPSMEVPEDSSADATATSNSNNANCEGKSRLEMHFPRNNLKNASGSRHECLEDK